MYCKRYFSVEMLHVFFFLPTKITVHELAVKYIFHSFSRLPPTEHTSTFPLVLPPSSLSSPLRSLPYVLLKQHSLSLPPTVVSFHMADYGKLSLILSSSPTYPAQVNILSPSFISFSFFSCSMCHLKQHFSVLPPSGAILPLMLWRHLKFTHLLTYVLPPN